MTTIALAPGQPGKRIDPHVTWEKFRRPKARKRDRRKRRPSRANTRPPTEKEVKSAGWVILGCVKSMGLVPQNDGKLVWPTSSLTTATDEVVAWACLKTSQHDGARYTVNLPRERMPDAVHAALSAWVLGGVIERRATEIIIDWPATSARAHWDKYESLTVPTLGCAY